MKTISTLVIVVLLALLGGSSFYIFKLSKQVSTLQQQIKDLEKETSPFAKIPDDPYYDLKENQKGPITTIAYNQRIWFWHNKRKCVKQHIVYLHQYRNESFIGK